MAPTAYFCPEDSEVDDRILVSYLFPGVSESQASATEADTASRRYLPMNLRLSVGWPTSVTKSLLWFSRDKEWRLGRGLKEFRELLANIFTLDLHSRTVMVVKPVGRQWKIVDFDTHVVLPGSFVAFLVRPGDFLFSVYGVCPCVYVFLFWMTQAVVMRAVLKHQWRSEYHLLALVIDAVLFVCTWARGRGLAVRSRLDIEEKPRPDRGDGFLEASWPGLQVTAEKG